MATKAEKLLERARSAAQTASRKRKEAKRTMYRKASAYGTAYALGKAVESGAIDRIPQLFGVPRTVVLGAGASVASFFVGGGAGDILDGVGDGAMCVAAFQFGAGQTVSGSDEDELAALDAEIDRARAALGDGVSGIEEEIVEVEEGVEAF